MIRSNEDNVEIHRFDDVVVEAIDVIVNENSYYLKNQMQIEEIPSNFTVAAIIRDGQVKIPNTMSEIKSNDELLIFAKPEDAQEAENLFVAR